MISKKERQSLQAEAKDPQTSAGRLTELSDSRRFGFLRPLLAKNPNLPIDRLLYVAGFCPRVVLENPFLLTLSIENPDRWLELLRACYKAIILKESHIPSAGWTWLVFRYLTFFRWYSTIEKHFSHAWLTTLDLKNGVVAPRDPKQKLHPLEVLWSHASFYIGEGCQNEIQEDSVTLMENYYVFPVNDLHPPGAVKALGDLFAETLNNNASTSNLENVIKLAIDTAMGGVNGQSASEGLAEEYQSLLEDAQEMREYHQEILAKKEASGEKDKTFHSAGYRKIQSETLMLHIKSKLIAALHFAKHPPIIHGV